MNYDYFNVETFTDVLGYFSIVVGVSWYCIKHHPVDMSTPVGQAGSLAWRAMPAMASRP